MHHRNERREAREAKRGVFNIGSRTALVKVLSADEAANEPQPTSEHNCMHYMNSLGRCAVCGRRLAARPASEPKENGNG